MELFSNVFNWFYFSGFILISLVLFRGWTSGWPVITWYNHVLLLFKAFWCRRTASVSLVQIHFCHSTLNLISVNRPSFFPLVCTDWMNIVIQSQISQNCFLLQRQNKLWLSEMTPNLVALSLRLNGWPYASAWHWLSKVPYAISESRLLHSFE